MKYYIKQRVFSLRDKFKVYDENENECFYVEGEFLTLGKKLRLYSMEGEELAYIEQKLFSLLPRYKVFSGGEEIAQVVKEFTFFRNEYTVDGPDWKVMGDFYDYDYTVISEGNPVVSVSKRWFSWGDTYEIDILENVDVSLAISVVLVIDACLETDND